MKKLNIQGILNTVQKEQIRDDLTKFSVGDQVCVHLKIKEGSKMRLQKINGTVINISNGGLNRTFVLRRETAGIGNELTFPLHSPLIVRVDVKKHGTVRRANLTYLRGRSGKAARIKSILKKQSAQQQAS